MKTNFSIQILKKLCTTCVVASMVSCGFLSNNTKKENNMDTSENNPTAQNPNTDTYIVKPNYEHPKFKALDEAFAKQEHRFEIDRCEFKYNDQAFFIGDTMEKIIEIFGEPDGRKIKSLDETATTFVYEQLKFRATFSTSNKTLKSYVQFLIDYGGHDGIPYNIIKFRKAPYQLDMKLNDFMELTDLQHDKSLGHDYSAFYIEGEKKCNENKNIGTEIASEPSFETTVIGGGHMIITEDGDFRPELTGPIERILVFTEN